MDITYLSNIMKIYTLIMAAGSGKRFGSELPKQYLKLSDGKTIIRRSIEAFYNIPIIKNNIIAVINFDYKDLYEEATDSLDILPPIQGGLERQDSVRNGLQALEKYNPDIVLIHDAARPFVTEDIIYDAINKITKEGYQAALPVIPIIDTLKLSKNGEYIENTVSREGLYGAQTPQTFVFKEILGLHQRFIGQNFTDDTLLFEQAGIKVGLSKGSSDNFKITNQEDLIKAERILLWQKKQE